MKTNNCEPAGQAKTLTLEEPGQAAGDGPDLPTPEISDLGFTDLISTQAITA